MIKNAEQAILNKAYEAAKKAKKEESKKLQTV